MDDAEMAFIEHLFDSFRLEMHKGFADLKMQLDRMEVRDEEQATSDSEWVDRMIEWTEKADRQ